MNLSNLITEAQRLAGRVDANFNNRTRRWLNEALTQWAIGSPWAALERTETFVADGTEKLVLPPRVLTVKWIADRTNQWPLDPSRHYDREYPTALLAGTSGAARRWTEGGVQAVIRQPATAGALEIQTTASDSFGLYVQGLAENSDASGTAERYYLVEEKIDVAGSGPYSTVNSYVQIDVLGKDDYTPADVTVKDSDSNLIARLPAHGFNSEYRVVEMVLRPTAGTQFDVRYVSRPAPLIENYQTPHPSVDPEYLIWYAASMIHRAQGQSQDAESKRAHAQNILQTRAYKDRMHGDKDLRALPDQEYWGHDDLYTVPDNQ